MINYELKYKVSEITKILKVEKKLIKDWAFYFSDYLNPNANPKKGIEREFTSQDICTLGYISHYWEENPDFENIKFGLNSGAQFEYPFNELTNEVIPIFREYSDDILKSNVWIIGGVTNITDLLILADSYKSSGDILVDIGIKDEQNKDLIYPAIYNYRHATELYLKAVLSSHQNTHNLKNLNSQFKNLIKANFNEAIPAWFENIIRVFDNFDPNGTTFRYGNEIEKEEMFVELIHIKKMMGYFAESIKRIKNNL